MFLKKTHSKNFIYLSLAETFRENGKVKHRVIAQLGRLDELLKTDQLKRLIISMSALTGEDAKESPNNEIHLENISEEDRINWGAVAVYRKIWELFDLELILKQALKEDYRKIQFNFAEGIFLMIVSCLIRPSSKLKMFQRQGKYFGLEQLQLHQLYRTLDLLAVSKDALEEKLFDKNRSLFNMQVDVVFYDVTTLYFESVKSDELRNFGYGKDGKFNEVQIVVGLLVDAEGRPVGFDVYPGNTFEGHTLKAALKKLKLKFNLRDVIIVADRGINSKLNLKEIKDAGFDYIVGCRLKGMPDKIKSEALNIANYEILNSSEENSVKFWSRPYQNPCDWQDEEGKRHKTVLDEILLCTWSLKRAEKDKKDRERLVEKAKELVSTPSKMINKRGAKKFIQCQTDKNPFLDQDKITEDSKWDGFYALQSSRKALSPADALQAYHRLWKIEESFRILKTNLQVRPIYHWTPQRIQGHLVLCFTAFLLQRTLEIELKKKNIHTSPEQLREALSSLQYSILNINDQRFFLRSKVEGAAAEILRSLKIALPKNITPIEGDQQLELKLNS